MKTLRFATFAVALGLSMAGSLLTAPVTAERAEAQVFQVDPRFAYPVTGAIVGGVVAAAICGPCTAVYIANGVGYGLLGGFAVNEVAGRPLLFRPAYAVQPVYYEPPRKKRKRKNS